MKLPLLVTEFLRRARSLYPAATAAVCGDQRLTYRALGERIDRFSSALEELGVTRGDVVAYLSFNCHRLLEAYYAVPQIGAVLLPVNIRLTAKDIAYILNDAQAKVVVIDRRLADLLAPVRSELSFVQQVVLMGGEADKACGLVGQDYESLIAGATARTHEPEIGEDDVAELFYTSGTTADPKGVQLTHRNLYLHALYAIIGLSGYDDHCVQLHTIPLFHVNGWGTPHFVTLIGGRHVLLPKFDPEDVLATIERERVTHVFLVPTMATALLSAPSFATADLSSLRRIKLGGAAAPPAIVRRLSERLPHCHIAAGYGLSETSPILTAADIKAGLNPTAEESARIRSTAGLPLPGVHIEIVNDANQPVPHDGSSAGEICVRSNVVTAGYLNLPDDTARAFAGGWFHTGDIGTIDDQGYVSIVDRKKDIIVTGGENVASLEIEKTIYDHPAVMECAVIALPDPVWGEIPAAIVVRKPGVSLDEAQILSHCRSHLAHFKAPRRVFFLDALPKGGTGKILKRELRQRFLQPVAGQATAVSSPAQP
ncbi:MAG: long-chain-fatty-acid--CoA ligase [Candidatus Eremiobacteraeota bacterium]|nr:long-chain-fatty-acid--CoA ligase [Candidatus Eremiobacteraeota bacterium]